METQTQEKSNTAGRGSEEETAPKKKRDVGILAQIVIILLLAVVLFYYMGTGKGGESLTGNAISEGTVSIQPVAASEIIPIGVPEVYGKELGVRYDDVSASSAENADATIKKLGNLDTSLSLQGEELKRYIGIASRISCEYCCGAATIIDANGEPTCGCAHSYAMRGLAKYLIKNHPSMSDDSILEEMGKWKVLFFPDQHRIKAAVLKGKGIELNYINLASQKYRGIEKGNSGAMVGAC